MNIKQVIENYIGYIKVEETPYYANDKENKPLYLETDDTLLIQINEEQIDLYKFASKDELDDFMSWGLLGAVILKEDILKCFILNTGNLLDKDIIVEGNSEKLGYKIIIDPQKVLDENYELFIANIAKVSDLRKMKAKDNKFVNICDDLIKKEGLCVFEINNLKILDQDLQEKIQAEPNDFIRTNLVIINNDFNSLLTFFEFNLPHKEEVNITTDNEVLLLKYPFYPELLCFLETAQKMQHNHLKYLDYYHVLEYFITAFAYKNLDDSMKKFVSIYLTGGNYEEFRRALVKITEEKNIAFLGQDGPLVDVLKQIDVAYIVDVINRYKLYDLLKQDIFGISDSRLLIDKWVDNIRNIQRVTIDKSNEEEFYKRLYSRLYSIRNALIHSKAKFKKKKEIDFLPLPEYQEKLKEDTVLIRELAIKLCKIQCVNAEK